MTRGQVSEQFEDVSYQYKVVSGESLVELSGAVKLHGITYGRMNSAIVKLYDAAVSGRYLSGGSVCLGVTYGGNVAEPLQIAYDVKLNSGLAVVMSGLVNGVVTYK